jgi:hypothetical protein
MDFRRLRPFTKILSQIPFKVLPAITPLFRHNAKKVRATTLPGPFGKEDQSPQPAGCIRLPAFPVEGRFKQRI